MILQDVAPRAEPTWRGRMSGDISQPSQTEVGAPGVLEGTDLASRAGKSLPGLRQVIKTNGFISETAVTSGCAIFEGSETFCSEFQGPEFINFHLAN